MSNLSAPQVDLNLITNRQQRKDAGVGLVYADAYNEAELAKYNNEYNYQLWLQQNEYNSPAAQVERLKAAGLNPNYNAIEGAGNATSMPSSHASYTPSIGNNAQRVASTALSAFNGVLGMLGESVNAVTKLTGVPYDLRTVRKLLNLEFKGRIQKQSLSNIMSALDVLQRMKDEQGYNTKDFGITYGGDIVPPLDREQEALGLFDKLDRGSSIDYSSKELTRSGLSILNILRKVEAQSKVWDLDNLKPAQLRKLNADIDLLGSKTDMSKQEVEAFKIMLGNKILGPIITTFIKSIF